jgi:hypothetical protein
LGTNQTESKNLIERVYAQWKVIYSDETGEHRLPTSKKAIRNSEQLIAEYEDQGNSGKENASKLTEIKEVLRNAKKRRMHVSVQVILATVITILLLLFLAKFHKKPGYLTERLSDERVTTLIQQNLQANERKLAGYEKELAAGRENYRKDYNWDEKEKDKYWDRMQEEIIKTRAKIEKLSSISIAEYRAQDRERDINNRKEQIKGPIFLFVSLIFYIIVSRRPAFMFWRKAANKEVFSKLENTVGAGIASAAFASLYTVPYATVEKIQWSNGMVTKGVSSLGTNFLIFAIIMILLLAYFFLVAITLPVRVLLNFLRNFVFYI